MAVRFASDQAGAADVFYGVALAVCTKALPGLFVAIGVWAAFRFAFEGVVGLLAQCLLGGRQPAAPAAE